MQFCVLLTLLCHRLSQKFSASIDHNKITQFFNSHGYQLWRAGITGAYPCPQQPIAGSREFEASSGCVQWLEFSSVL